MKDREMPPVDRRPPPTRAPSDGTPVLRGGADASALGWMLIGIGAGIVGLVVLLA